MRVCLFVVTLASAVSLFAGAPDQDYFVHVTLPEVGDVRAKIVENKDDGNVVVKYAAGKNRQVQTQVKASEVSRSAELATIKKETLVHFEVEPGKHAVGAVLDTFENGRVFLFRGKKGNSSLTYKEPIWKNADELSPPRLCIGEFCVGNKVVALKQKSCKEGSVTHMFENGWVRIFCSGLLGLNKWRKIDELTIVPR